MFMLPDIADPNSACQHARLPEEAGNDDPQGTGAKRF